MDNNIDNLLNNLFEHQELEHPSDNFTSKVMDKIYAQEELKTLYTKSVFDRRIIILCSIILTVFIVAMFYFNFNFINNLIPKSIDFKPVSNLFLEIKTSIIEFVNLFHFIWQSSLTLIIIFSVLSLYLLDKLINKTLHISFIL